MFQFSCVLPHIWHLDMQGLLDGAIRRHPWKLQLVNTSWLVIKANQQGNYYFTNRSVCAQRCWRAERYSAHTSSFPSVPSWPGVSPAGWTWLPALTSRWSRGHRRSWPSGCCGTRKHRREVPATVVACRLAAEVNRASGIFPLDQISLLAPLKIYFLLVSF